MYDPKHCNLFTSCLAPAVQIDAGQAPSQSASHSHPASVKKEVRVIWLLAEVVRIMQY